MNEQIVSRRRTLASAFSPPHMSRRKAKAVLIGAGVALALSLSSLLGFTPKAWGDTGEYALVPVSTQKTTVSYQVELKGFNGDAQVIVSGKKDGRDFTWRANRNMVEMGSGGSSFASGDKGINTSTVPSIVDDWATYGKPFSLYVDGSKVASSETGGDIWHFSVLWEGFLRASVGWQDQAAGNADMWIRGWSKDWNQQTTYYRPMGTQSAVGSSWNLLDTRGTTWRDGGAHTIELVLYDRVEVADPTGPTDPTGPVDPSTKQAPSVSLRLEDGAEYVEGTWTNENVVVDAVSNDRDGGYYVSIFERDGAEVARSVWATSPIYKDMATRFVVSSSTPKEGAGYFGVLLGGDGSAVSSASVSKVVKVDKEAPVISDVSISGGKPSVSASDALSGVASIYGKGFGSSVWKPIDQMSLSGGTGTLSVKVVDHAGNATVGTVNIKNGEVVNPPDQEGGDSFKQGDGFKAQRAA